jgi:hypothetical protein
MWYSTIHSNPTQPAGISFTFLNDSSTLQNLHIDGAGITRDSTNYGSNTTGDNWLIDQVWIEHEGPSIWADGLNGTMQHSRIDESWSDCINLNHGGAGTTPDGQNLTAYDNFGRGCGDDEIAINDNGAGILMSNMVVLQNTTVAPWGANIGVYGGGDSIVANNLMTDSVQEYALSIGNSERRVVRSEASPRRATSSCVAAASASERSSRPSPSEWPTRAWRQVWSFAAIA